MGRFKSLTGRSTCSKHRMQYEENGQILRPGVGESFLSRRSANLPSCLAAKMSPLQLTQQSKGGKALDDTKVETLGNIEICDPYSSSQLTCLFLETVRLVMASPVLRLRSCFTRAPKYNSPLCTVNPIPRIGHQTVQAYRSFSYSQARAYTPSCH